MICRANKPRRGAAAVEAAIVLPVLLMMAVIAFDFARVYYFSVTLWGCARQGAIYYSNQLAVTNSSQPQSSYKSVSDAALEDWTPSLTSTATPTVTSSTGTDSSGNPYAEVTVDWTFQTLTSFSYLVATGSPMHLSSTVQMRVPPEVPK